MTAAANLARSNRGTSKGLFLFFSLLCLVGFASSLIDNHDLEKFKEIHEESLQGLDTVKANLKSMMDDTSEKISKVMSSLDTMAEQQKKAMEGRAEDFPSMDTFLESAKVQLEKLKAYQDKKKEELEKRIDDMEKKLGKEAKLIKFLEKLHNEL